MNGIGFSLAGPHKYVFLQMDDLIVGAHMNSTEKTYVYVVVY
jgi:hypothetical protein